MKSMNEYIWVVVGSRAQFPCGIFIEKEKAIIWIGKHAISGILTRYPVNEGLYDWSIDNGLFNPQRDDQRTAEFIGRFSCASLEHYHCEDGMADSNC